MGLRPGIILEISSHFIPWPRSSMTLAFSSADHLLCFLAGLSVLWAAILRAPRVPEAGATGRCRLARGTAASGN